MMKNEKDIKLVNIYIRIHNRQALTMDDLAYLAKYNPVCFKKTCDNLIYKVPEARALVESVGETAVPAKGRKAAPAPRRNPFELAADEKLQNEKVIQQFFESMKKIESSEVSPLQVDIDLEQVKELLGDLYMESLFPHDGLQGYFDIAQEENGSKFNVRV